MVASIIPHPFSDTRFSVMPPLDQTPRSSPSLLNPLSNLDACSNYLVELVNELPLAASQFGLVLGTALEYKTDPSGVRTKGPADVSSQSEPGFEQPHYRSKSMPIPDAPGNPLTELDVTISGYATTFYARCEPLLMRAAASEDAACAGRTQELTIKQIADWATAENFAKALERDDLVVWGHHKNVLSLISNILDHRSSERARLGKEEVPAAFFCINDIWKQPLASLVDNRLQIMTRAIKFVISEEDLLKDEPNFRKRCQEVETTHGLVLGPMLESDIKIMLECNKVQYPENYGKTIIKYSQCFRGEDGNMVAWAGTHGDFSIAALHVLPKYRQAGLGRLVLNSLALMHTRLARDILTSLGDQDNNAISSSRLFAHADCLDDNLPTMVFMERSGWRRVGAYLWLGLFNKAIPSVEPNEKYK